MSGVPNVFFQKAAVEATGENKKTVPVGHAGMDNGAAGDWKEAEDGEVKKID